MFKGVRGNGTSSGGAGSGAEGLVAAMVAAWSHLQRRGLATGALNQLRARESSRLCKFCAVQKSGAY